MRWFFLIVMVIAGAFINVALFTDSAPSKAAAIATFNIALGGLSLIWYGVYFEQNVINANCKDLGFALLCFSVGIFIMQGGMNAALADSCETFFSSGRHKLRHDFLRFVQSLGYCKELGYVVAFAGAWVAYAGGRLVFKIVRRSYG